MYMHLPVPFQLVQPNYKKKQYFFLFLSKQSSEKELRKKFSFFITRGMFFIIEKMLTFSRLLTF